MSLYETRLTTRLDAVMSMLADRQAGHRMTMRLWGPQPVSTDHGARAAVGCQWAVTDLDPGLGVGTVLVRSQVAPEATAPWAQTQETCPLDLSGLEAVDITVTIAAMYTPFVAVPKEWHQALKQGADGTARPAGQGVAYRNRRVPVPTERLEEWATATARRHGIVGEVKVENAAAVRIKGALTRTASIQIDDVPTGGGLERVLQTGIGKGRSYGLGMVLVHRSDRSSRN